MDIYPQKQKNVNPPSKISSLECLVGFAKGLESMQIGEKRRFYA